MKRGKKEPPSEQALKVRKTDYEVHPLILGRWSPRAMTKESIDQSSLMTLLDAARWAPSSYNAQPWRFIYAHRGTKEWDRLFSLLVPFNQEWANSAAVLLVILSCKVFEDQKPSPTHSFDTGTAWGYLALQGHINGLVVHGMRGFNYSRVKEVCEIPDNHQIEAMAAIGKQGEKESLPEGIREKEKPSDRKPLEELVMKGKFKN